MILKGQYYNEKINQMVSSLDGNPIDLVLFISYNNLIFSKIKGSELSYNDQEESQQYSVTQEE